MTCEITIEQLMNIMKSYPEIEIDIETRFGFKKIEAIGITAINSKIYEIKTINEKVQVSPEHLLFNEYNQWVKAKNIKIGDKLLTKNGLETVISIIVLDEKEDLYDVQIADVKEYYANNFVSHNSTIVQSIVYGLYNKNSDLKGSSKTSLPVKELINETNKKELEVHIVFDNGIEVQRGLKPDYFKILKDGVNLADKSSKTIDQKFLENEILNGLSYDIFNKVNFISAKAISTPFLYMSPSDRKAFIENILDIRILYYIQQVIKQKISNTKLELKTVESELQMLRNFVISEEKSIKDQKEKRFIQLQKIQELTENKEKLIVKTINEKEDIALQLYDLKLEGQGVVDKKKRLSKEIISLEENLVKKDSIVIEVENIERDIQELKNNAIQLKLERDNYYKNKEGFVLCGDCPTVFKIIGNFDEEKYKSDIESIKRKIKELVQKKNDFDKEINKLEKMSKEKVSKENEISVLNFQLKSIKDKIIEKENEFKKKEKLIENLQNDLDDMKIPEVDETNLNEYKRQLEDKEKEHDDYLRKIDKFNYLKDVLGNKNIRQELFENYIPLFEKRVNEVLEILMEDDSFSFRIEIDKDFNLIGYRNGKKSNIFKLSEGQKSSINFAFLFAVMYVLQIKNGFRLDFLFIDEILDGALSMSRKEKVLKILKDMSKDIPIMLVSHDQGINKEYFDHEIFVDIENKVSKYIFK